MNVGAVIFNGTLNLGGSLTERIIHSFDVNLIAVLIKGSDIVGELMATNSSKLALNSPSVEVP